MLSEFSIWQYFNFKIRKRSSNLKGISMTELSFSPKGTEDNPSSDDINVNKRKFLIAATAGVGAVAAGSVALPLVSSMLPSERAKAAGAPVEVDVSKVAEGEMITTEWRGMPVWILHRSDAMTDALAKNNANLTDPMMSVDSQQPAYCKNDTRSLKKNMAVIVGKCTHLGCTPNGKLAAGGDMGTDWTGGFFCPCHGSKFDLAGRVFKGSPAPINLVIPPHRYLADGTLLIGEDTVKA